MGEAMKKLSVIILIMAATPAFAESAAFFSLYNPHTVVLVAFLIFAGALVYFRVPHLLAGLLDKRADGIRKDLDEAKALRDEAQSLLASYERKQKDVAEQSKRIIEGAEREAREAAKLAKEDLKASIARRLAAADEQIASAESAAIREVRDRAVQIAVAAAREVVAANLTATRESALIDDSIKTVATRLH